MVLGAMAYVAAMATMTAATGVWTFVLAQTFVGIGIACTGSSLAMTATARAGGAAWFGHRRRFLVGVGDRAGSALLRTGDRSGCS